MIETADRQNAAIQTCPGALDRPLAVTHVITSITTGGAEVMLLKLIRSMDASRIRSSVIALQGEGSVGSLMRDAGIPVQALDVHPRTAVAGLWRLAMELRRQRPRIVQTWMYHADLFGSLASLSVPGVPVVWNIRCGKPDPVIHKRATYWTSRACAAASPIMPSRIICCSQAALEGHAAAGYDRSKMVVVPNGFDTAAFRPDARSRASVRDELGLPAETLLIGMIARFDAAKDHANFCRAAAIVSRANQQVHFVLCGPEITAGNRALMACIEKVGIAQRCHLLGPRSDVPRLMASLDVLVSSSLAEGFSNVLGEAMSCAVPCVATDVGDSRLILGDTGSVVPVRAPEVLAGSVMALIEMGTERRALIGAAARRRVAEKFSLAAVARKYEMTYEELASRCAA